MWLKENINKVFNNEKNITIERYKSSKLIFVLFIFLFFLNFSFIWAKFNLGIFTNELFSITLWYIYILLVISMMFYFYFFMKNVFLDKFPKYVFIIIFVLLFLLAILLLLPIILNGWVNWIIDLVKFYF